MTDEVAAFLMFTTLCSAVLIGLMVIYAIRLSRLRATVAVLSQVNDMLPQRAPARRE